MEDKRIMESTMDGKPYQAGYHAASLRRHIWREHLGLIQAQELDASNDPNAQPPNDCGNNVGEGEEWEFVADPLGDKVWEMWTGRATKNTELYRYIFRADPDDNIKTWKDYDTFSPRQTVKQGHIHDPFIPVKELRAKLDEIRGHLVWMPLDFLKDENMAENMEKTIKSRLGGAMQVNSYTEVSVGTSDLTFRLSNCCLQSIYA
jgi:phospholipase D1/2